MKYLLLILPFMWGCAEKKVECPCLTIKLSDIGKDTSALKTAKKLIKRHGCGEIYFDDTFYFANGNKAYNLHAYYGSADNIDTSTVYMIDEVKKYNPNLK